MSRPAARASMPGTVRSDKRALAASMIWADEPRKGRASSAITVRAGRVHMRSNSENWRSPQSVLLELGLGQGKLPDARELLGAGPRHLGVQAGHVERAVGLAEAGDHGAEDLHGVGHGPAVAAVERLVEPLHLHVHLAEAAELIHQRGVSHVVVLGVGQDDEVGGYL